MALCKPSSSSESGGVPPSASIWTAAIRYFLPLQTVEQRIGRRQDHTMTIGGLIQSGLTKFR